MKKKVPHNKELDERANLSFGYFICFTYTIKTWRRRLKTLIFRLRQKTLSADAFHANKIQK